MAAFCTCCGAAITLKSTVCAVCGAPSHGMKAVVARAERGVEVSDATEGPVAKKSGFRTDAPSIRECTNCLAF